MISEVFNSLFLTYCLSEYLLVNNDGGATTTTTTFGRLGRKRAMLWAVFLLILLVINVLDRVTGAQVVLNDMLQAFWHAPRVIFAATAYVVALYVDIQYHRKLDFAIFCRRVFVAFCKILPAYPFLAVLISFVFLFVINIWEALHLPDEWLNAPIYYGTLYGPFAWVYIYVKRQACQDANRLPT